MTNPKKAITLALLLMISSPGVQAEEAIIYKKVDNRELKLLVEKPAGWKASDKNPCMVYFFGGSWVGGTAEQFHKQSSYFATRGMVGLRVEYRVIPKGDKGPPVMCCADAKSAMRYVRSHATDLGIDPDRIAAAGGSAGGHLAAFTSMVEGLDDPKDDLKVSCKPNALVLFNPVFNNGPGEWGNERVGGRYRSFSPAHNIAKGAPPTIVFLGEKDHLIPVKVATDFEEKMKKVGSRCDTHLYPDAGHGFFNKAPHYQQTLMEADKFLGSIGWLKGEPKIAPAR